jgi:hypothetical protein
MKAPEPLEVDWQGRRVRVRHDDPTSDRTRREVPSSVPAVELATDVEGLRLVLASTVGDRYRVRVSEDGSTVGL